MARENWLIRTADDDEDGPDYIGPFASFDDAMKFAEELPHKEWEVCSMLEPNYV